MEDWKTLLGSGSGVCFIFTEKQGDGSYYNVTVQAQITDAKNRAEGANAQQETARSQGIFENIPVNRIMFLKAVKGNTFKTDTGIYEFDKRVYINETLTQAQAIDFVAGGDTTGLVSHLDTKKLTAANGSTFLDFIL